MEGGVTPDSLRVVHIDLDSLYPNPFPGDTEVVFVIPQTGPWSVAITNVASDLVRSSSGTAEIGDTVLVIWDGNGDSGNSRPNGIYFARITAGEYAFIKKLILLWSQ